VERDGVVVVVGFPPAVGVSVDVNLLNEEGQARGSCL